MWRFAAGRLRAEGLSHEAADQAGGRCYTAAMENFLRNLGFGDWAPILDGPLRALVLIALAIVSLRVVRGLVRRMLVFVGDNHSERDANRVRRIETITSSINYVITVVVALITTVMVLAEFGISIAPLLATAGIAGVAIGFGTQSLVKDYFTGIVLLMENQIRLGDAVEVGGKVGIVERVTLRYVRLRDYQGNVHFVPSGAITVVSNRTTDYVYETVDATISNTPSSEGAIEVLRGVLQELREEQAFSSWVIGELEPLEGAAPAVRIRLKVPKGQQEAVGRELLRRTKMAFKCAEASIELPKVTVNTVR